MLPKLTPTEPAMTRFTTFCEHSHSVSAHSHMAQRTAPRANER